MRNTFAFVLFFLALAFVSCASDGGDGDEGGGESSGGSEKGDDIAKYSVAAIGGQTWIAKNLDYYVEGSKCYDDDEANCEKYGRLYDWAMAMALPEKCNNIHTSESKDCKIKKPHQGICPKGYHIPSEADWKELLGFAGGGERKEGLRLKTADGWEDVAGEYYGDWESGNGTDDYGFAALPGGEYGIAGFGLLGFEGNWWSAAEAENSNQVYQSSLDNKSNSSGWSKAYRFYFFSVRCVKD